MIGSGRIGHPTDGGVSDAVHTGRRGPALVRARAWYARALLAGDPRTARAAVRKGLALLDEHQRGIGADDLRAGLARQRLDLAALGVDLALAQGSPSAVFRAVEQARATVVVRDSVRPPADPELADLLTRLRATTTAARLSKPRFATAVWTPLCTAPAMPRWWSGSPAADGCSP